MLSETQLRTSMREVEDGTRLLPPAMGAPILALARVLELVVRAAVDLEAVSARHSAAFAQLGDLSQTGLTIRTELDALRAELTSVIAVGRELRELLPEKPMFDPHSELTDSQRSRLLASHADAEPTQEAPPVVDAHVGNAPNAEDLPNQTVTHVAPPPTTGGSEGEHHQ